MKPKHSDVIRPGDTLFVVGVFYDLDTQELEVFPVHRRGWWSIPMTPEEASRAYAKIERQGVFFYQNVRHVLLRSRRVG